ncbi:N-alpha-acetyltransferase 25, NatB auxiliary subunit-like [Anneissia japonica]|uniref:N-alpha-acetyltransferase 25, NatB auxiliary subunit-like n=1 Tax=Anneissia japonica TaxID=1529436 RepID=UPI0014255029|nr:N-alpha-acetyltransferase 25, NatB auxiliary subunit-like [Anneissia japonica]
MAARSSHVDSVNERRLRPIYDNLDNGNNKAAIQAADKVLKKQKDLLCAKVLKALALQRTGKSSDAFLLAEDVLNAEPKDDSTLQALTICFREMQKPELIVRMYECAAKACPNEEMYSHLFMAYVRTGDYKKQQQTAISLYKVAQKNPYYFWGVMSIFMQAYSAPDPKLATSMYYPLCLRMVEKMINENKIDNEAEVSIYIMILEALGMYEKAMEVLKGDLGKKYITTDKNLIPERIADLYRKMEKWAEANSAYKDLIKDNPNNWLFYQQYFHSAFKLYESKWTPEANSENKFEWEVDCTPEQVKVFIDKVLEGSLEDQCRAPYLARMELYKIMKEKNSIPVYESLTELLTEYFAKFGSKCCCFWDVKTYLDILNEEDIAPFIQSLVPELEMGEFGNLQIATNTKQIQRHLSWLQLCRYLGLHEKLSNEEKLLLAKDLCKRHIAGLCHGEKLLSSDLQYSDDYCILAAHILISIWREIGDSSILLDLCVILERAKSRSPSNHHIKLLLIRLYCLLGAFGPIPDLYDGIEIKHIQQDTISYQVTRFIQAVGHFTASQQFYNAILKFFTSNHKDTSEYIITAYKFGSFQKIPEFIEFRKRVSNSISFSVVTIEKMLLEIMTDAEVSGCPTLDDIVKEMEINPSKDEVCWDDLRDNRDLDVLISWDPKSRQLSEEDKTESFLQVKGWHKLRCLTLRVLAAASQLVSTSDRGQQSNNGQTQDHGKVMAKLVDEMKEHFKELETNPIQTREFPEHGPPSTPAKSFLEGQHHVMFNNIVSTVADIYELQNGFSETTQKKINENLQIVLDTYKESLGRSNRNLLPEDGDKRKLDRNVLPELIMLSETLVFIILLSGVCFKIIKPLKTQQQRKNKKKKGVDGKPLPPVFDQFKGYMESLLQLTDDLIHVFENIKADLVAFDLSRLSIQGKYKLMEDEDNFVKTLWTEICGSYEDACSEVLMVMKSRKAYATNFKL